MHFQLHCLEPIASEQREPAGTIECHHIHLASLPGAAAAWQASAPDAIITCSAPSVLPKLPLDTAYTEVTSTVDNFRYNKEEGDYIEKG